MNVIAIAATMIPLAVVGFMMGLATTKAVEATARQPEASGKINSILLLGLALCESIAIYAFVLALILIVSK